jgi:hypothetical protein
MPCRSANAITSAGCSTFSSAAARTNRSISAPGEKTTYARASAEDSLRTVCERPPGMWTTSPRPSAMRFISPSSSSERVADPGDGRAQLIRTTALGAEVFAVVREFVAEVEARLEDRLGADKLTRLRSLLRELDEAL